VLLEGSSAAALEGAGESLKYDGNVTERRWRLVDLARSAGVSEQQVRNYLADGLLPPVRRAANNYRVLTDQHADALRTLRSLAAGHGWARTRAILTAVHRDDVPAALAEVDAGHAALARERATIAAAVHAFTQAAGGTAPVLRLWERRGLLRPQRDPATGYRVFDPAEQRVAHLVAVLRAGGFGFPIIEAVIATMRASGTMANALAELSRRDEQVNQLSRRRLQASADLYAYLAEHYPAP
jgi:DNA-binding transcriptional MerR regulator